MQLLLDQKSLNLSQAICVEQDGRNVNQYLVCSMLRICMHCTVYIDDLTEAEGVDLKKEIIRDPVQRPFPLNFHERTQHIFPNEHSVLQKQLIKVE